MLERGKFIAIYSEDVEMNFPDEVVHYIDEKFPLEDVELFYKLGRLKVREATEQEKRLCYYAMEYLDQWNGIFVKEIDKLEKIFANNPEVNK